jgi:predicted  nucleic acid-binding Zn-ribbon protein
MALFKGKDTEKEIEEEIKKLMERVNSLSKEVKQLREEVEFLSTLAKKNEDGILEQGKNVDDLHSTVEELVKFLEE